MQSITRQEFSNDPTDFQRLHEAVLPADVREGEGLKAILKLLGKQESQYQEARIWRISPVGVELIVEKNHLYSKGEQVDLTLIVGGQQSRFQGSIVECSAEFNEDSVRMGIRLSPAEEARDGQERRQEDRWPSSSQFDPTAVAQNPAKFNDYLYFKVADISVSGLQLVSSLRNKFLIPGMTLSLQISLPMVGQISLPVKIARVGCAIENGKDHLAVGTTFINISQAAKATIGQYLLQFGTEVDIEELRSHEFYPSSFASAIDFGFLRTDEEYKEVLNLRYRAYGNAGKLSVDATLDDMADIFDTRSRIIIGRHQGKIVASVRITFAELGQKFEIENDAEWSAEFPPREETVEVSKLCTDPEYRGSDLLISIFRQIVLTSLQAGRVWAIIGTTQDMLGLYEKVGLQKTQTRYLHKQFRNIEHVVAQGHLPSFIKGEGVSALHWNVIWKGLSEYLHDNQTIHMDRWSYVRLAIYRLCAPLAWLANHRIRNPRKARK